MQIISLKGINCKRSCGNKIYVTERIKGGNSANELKGVILQTK